MALNLVTAGFFVFFAAVFAAYWLSPNNTSQKVVLLLASYIFYATFDYRFCLLLAAATGLGYVIGELLPRAGSLRKRKALLVVGVASNLLLLAAFKYFDFFARGAARILTLLGFGADSFTLGLVLPVGISFFLFKIISYLVDVFRSETSKASSPLDFAVYVAFFPQLLAGPIDRAARFLPQLAAKRRFDYGLAVEGSRQVLWGLFKKLALADGIAVIVEAAYRNHASSTGPALAFAAVLYSFQIYCDFSGYTDISIGVSRLLGMQPVRNFAYPYFSQSVAEFWRRWNISISSWFRDYVYIPLGGSRVGKPRLVANILLTFVLSGLWHGAGVKFLAWGGVLGVGVVATSITGARVLKDSDVPGGERMSLLSAGRMLGTFAYITLTWVFFRAESGRESLQILARILTPSLDAAAWLAMKDLLMVSPLTIAALGAFVCLEWIQRRHECPLAIQVPVRALRWAAYCLVLWLTLLMMQPVTGRFIYFSF